MKSQNNDDLDTTKDKDNVGTESNFFTQGRLENAGPLQVTNDCGLSGDGTMLRNQQNMAQTLGTQAGNLAGQFRGIAVARNRSVSSLSHSDSSGKRQGYSWRTGTDQLMTEPETTPTPEIKPACQCSPGDPAAAIWARLIVSQALSS